MHRRKNNSDSSQEVPVKLVTPAPPSPPPVAPILIGGMPMPVPVLGSSKASRAASPAPKRPSLDSSKSSTSVPKLAISTNVPHVPSKRSTQSSHSSKSSHSWRNRLWLVEDSKHTVSASPVSSTSALTPSPPPARAIIDRGVARKEEGSGQIFYLSERRKLTSSDSTETLKAGLGICDGTIVADIKEILVSELMPARARELGLTPELCLKVAVVSQGL